MKNTEMMDSHKISSSKSSHKTKISIKPNFLFPSLSQTLSKWKRSWLKWNQRLRLFLKRSLTSFSWVKSLKAPSQRRALQKEKERRPPKSCFELFLNPQRSEKTISWRARERMAQRRRGSPRLVRSKVSCKSSSLGRILSEFQTQILMVTYSLLTERHQAQPAVKGVSSWDRSKFSNRNLL